MGDVKDCSGARPMTEPHDDAVQELETLLLVLSRARAISIERHIAHGGTSSTWAAMPLSWRVEQILGEHEEALEELEDG